VATVRAGDVATITQRAERLVANVREARRPS